MGPCAGGAVYSPALTDFIFMVQETSYMFITGPDVVKTVTGEDVTQEELGGAMTPRHQVGRGHVRRPRRQGRASTRCATCCPSCPSNNLEEPPWFAAHRRPAARDAPSCVDLIPASPNQPYDMKKVIAAVVDDGDFFEYAPTGRRTSCAGSPASTATRSASSATSRRCSPACSTSTSLGEGGRFVRTCDAFNIPLVTFVDVPGFLPGTDQEYGGIIRHGAKLLYAYCESTVPRIQVITRKAYGGAYVVMNSKSIGADLAFAWPSAELAVMGPQRAVEILYRRELAERRRPRGPARPSWSRSTPSATPTPTTRPSGATSTTSSTPPSTRTMLINGLDLLRTKREDLPKRKHGNVPL